MKKLICFALALLLTAALAGCGQTPAAPAESTPAQAAVAQRFTAENEIVTYERLDPEKTQLTVSSLGNNANIHKLSAAFEAQNPDVQVICVDVTGGSWGYRPVVDWVKNGVGLDVMFVNPESFADNAQIMEYIEDLSGNPIVENFEAAALKRVAVEGHAYFLPAPSEINCILYNKTLFAQYDWAVPKTFDEFVALCVQIREDTGGAVQPWNPNAKYDLVFSTALEAITYEELFGGADNRAWYNDFCEGKATFAGHMEPFFEMIQSLIDNGILLEEHFTYSATTRGKEFQTGKIAMYNAPVSRMASDEYEFGYMPYPTTEGEMGYVNDYFSAMLCVPKGEHTEKERDALERYLAFFASVEGQQALIGETLMVSNVKNVPLNEAAAMADIKAVIAQGHKFSRLDFPGSSEINWSYRESAQQKATERVGERNWTFRDCAMAMVKGEKTGAQLIAEIDEKPYKTAEESGAGSAVKIAEVAEDFTILDFSNYIADMYREKAGADIGLINHGIAYRGNLVRLFAGDIYDSYINPIKPRSFENGSTLVKLSMTGQQIRDALNHPVGNNSVSDSVYAFSGLRCTVAPWNTSGEKMLSVTLADESELEPDKLYTVAAWAGTVAEEYITETLDAYEGTWEELMTAKMRADGTLAPANDGRITLVWE